ncbi:TPA: SPFH domain-containing protein [Legionella pneumophila]|uniref:Protease subunit HflK n=3 Tax=Legionella TaxID=445 RepID=A0A0W0REP5_LEGBO|nr:SPFH domain-containing protein [Legionella bozemanae]KTC69560.1 protease subunit HflK [Legionella bozemanae]STP13838.1 FtsH protease regulator HflK [Legionella bozemanae]HAT1722212.1 SPFH domain-containing protein [Legionella pneumophila]
MMIELLIGIAVLLLIFVLTGLFIVKQQEVALIERLGKYHSIAHAGLNFKIPFIDWIAGKLSLRIQQLDVKVETKTKDNVIVQIQVSVQYRIKDDGVYDAFYKLEDPTQQITAYVLDLVRSETPTMILDDIFEKKDSIANAVKSHLSETMQDFGFEIVKALVTNIELETKVKNAMNEINEQQRLQVAAQAKGEAEKILIVKKAEAEAESKRLQGEGTANQRKAIIDGLSHSVEDFQKSVPGVSSADIMNLVLITQYFDTLKEIGSHNKSNTILLPQLPNDIASQLQQSIITGNVASADIKN